MARVHAAWPSYGSVGGAHALGGEGGRGAYTHERRDVVAGCHDRRLKVLGHREHHEGGADRVVEHEQGERARQEVATAGCGDCSRTTPPQSGRAAAAPSPRGRAATQPGAHAWCAARAVGGDPTARQGTDKEVREPRCMRSHGVDAGAEGGRWAGHITLSLCLSC